MQMFLIGLGVGLFVGVPIGILVLGLCAAAAKGDRT